MDLSIELASPVVLRREGGVEAASIILAPQLVACGVVRAALVAGDKGACIRR